MLMRKESRTMTPQVGDATAASSLCPPISPKRPTNAPCTANISSTRVMSPKSSGYELLRRTSSDCGQNKIMSPPSPMRLNKNLRDGLNASDIFRGPVSNYDEKQSRNELSLRPSEGRDNEIGERQQIVPLDRLDHAAFRHPGGNNIVHSPIGTPKNSEPMTLNGTDNSNVPIIRPSLSCPTSFFESPLYRHYNHPKSSGSPLKGIGSIVRSPGTTDDLDPLNCTDVSEIEYEDESSFQMCDENSNLPMRNLNDAFELLVVSSKSGTTKNSIHGRDEPSIAENMRVIRSGIDNRDSEETLNKDASNETSDKPGQEKKNECLVKPSPTSVTSLESESISPRPLSQSEKGVEAEAEAVKIPRFNLHKSLKGELCQGVVDRVSFYSIVRDINKEALDTAITDPRGSVYNDGSVHGRKGPAASGGNAVVAEDGRVHIHPDPEEESRSVLVLACLAESPSNESDVMFSNARPNQSNNIKKSISLGAALIDEEWWLLGAIAARSPEEVALNRSIKLPPTFAEAMGEKEEPNEAKNPATSSRTQLWKPGRSWWEAKSGKNPWVEPIVHNNRWRYLWPLIHYHKFIAKCIKKLKRNGIDVKTSTSNVSKFLRLEVCSVSDHLAAMSKFDSEEWTSALSHFDGWTTHDPNIECVIRDLVSEQKLHGVSEVSDIRSSLLRSQLDEKVLQAMQLVRDDALKAGKDVYGYAKDARGNFGNKNISRDGPGHQFLGSENNTTHYLCPRQPTSFITGSYQYQGDGHCSIPFPPDSVDRTWSNNGSRRSGKTKKRGKNWDAEWCDPMGTPAHYSQPDIYGMQFDHHHHQYNPSQATVAFGSLYGLPLNSHYFPAHSQQFGMLNHLPPHVAPMEYHGSDTTYCMPNPSNQFGHQFFNTHCPPNGNFESVVAFDHGLHPTDMSAPYMHPPMAQTPNRYQTNEMHGQFPLSPYWGHLNISQLPGLAPSPNVHTPSNPTDRNLSRSYRKRQGKGATIIDGKAKSLIMFPNQTNSPASRFVMSPQDKSNPYYSSKNSQGSSNVLDVDKSGQEESFLLPAIEDFSQESPGEAAHTSLHSNTSMEMMPPAVKKLYMGSDNQREEDVASK